MKKFLILTFIIIASVFIYPVFSQKKNAVGVRIMPNDEHFPVAIWYERQDFLKKGSSQAIQVDGYDAIKDGNTVYVNVANVLHPEAPSFYYQESEQNFFTNIYLISYSDDESENSQEIFSQILANWKFNTNINKDKFPDKTFAQIEELKQKLRRDTRRLADMAYVIWVLEQYHNVYKSYPALEAGTYIAGESLSKWPSWQETLGAKLGITMPLDPINKFFQKGCDLGGTLKSGVADDCYCRGYDPATCWDNKTRKFNQMTDIKAGLSNSNNNYIFTNGTIANLQDALVYYYRSLNNGAGYEFNAANWETGYIGGEYISLMQSAHAQGNIAPVIIGERELKMAPNSEAVMEVRAYDYNPGDVLKWERISNTLKCLTANPLINFGNKTDGWNKFNNRYESYRNIKIQSKNLTECSETISLKVTDNSGAESLFSFAVRVKNMPPSFGGVTKSAGVIDYPFSADIKVYDSPGDTFSCSIEDNLPLGLSLSGCKITGTPTKEGSFSFTVKIKDNGSLEAKGTAQIDILNKPPRITSSSKAEVLMGENWEFIIEANDNTPYNEIDSQPHPNLPLFFDLYPKPVWLSFNSANLIKNPSFEEGITKEYGEIEDSCINLTQDNFNKYSGSYSGKVTILKTTTDCANGSLNYNHCYGIMHFANFGYHLGGKTITGSVAVKAPVGRKVTLLLHADDLNKEDGNWADNSSGYKTITGNGNWQPIVVTWVVPAVKWDGSDYNGSVIQFRLSYEQQGIVGDEVYWDGLQLKEGSLSSELMSGVPPAKQAYTFDISVADAFGKIATQTFTLNAINHAPVITDWPRGLSPYHTGESFTYKIIASDQDKQQRLTYSLEGVPSSVIAIHSQTGEITTHGSIFDINDYGNYAAKVKVRDGYDTAEKDFMLVIEPLCGNGVQESSPFKSEECDLNIGIANSPADSAGRGAGYECTYDCRWTGGKCGDGKIQANHNEQCDGAAGIVTKPEDSYPQGPHYGCDKCSWNGEYCGDGKQNGNEECDNGMNGTDYNDACEPVRCLWTYKTMSTAEILKGGRSDAIALDNDNDPKSSEEKGSAHLKLLGVMPTPYLWIANTGTNQITKIRTYASVGGIYYKRTATGWDETVKETPGDKIINAKDLQKDGVWVTSPSRTAVNVLDGSVWVAGRTSANVAKLDIDGNIKKICSTGSGPRGVAIDGNGDVWIGNYDNGNVVKISGDDADCVIQRTVNTGGCPYGLAIDSKENIWVSNRCKGKAQKIDPVQDDTKALVAEFDVGNRNYEPYGIAIDLNDNVWVADTGSNVYKVDTINNKVVAYNIGCGRSRGVSIDKSGDIWVACDGCQGWKGNQISRIDPDAPSSHSVYDNSSSGNFPVGICGDSEGYIWIGNQNSNSVTAFNNLGTVVQSTTGVIGNPYTYSDMTGLNRAMMIRQGVWQSAVIDSAKDIAGNIKLGDYTNQHWGKIVWDEIKGSLQDIKVYIRVKDDINQLLNTSWTAINNSDSITFTGRYLQIKIELKSTERGVTPVVSNLRIE